MDTPHVEEAEVQVVTHDPAWRRRYNVEARRVKAVLGDYAVAVEHIGSTAVPGLDAKPIVDILVGSFRPPGERQVDSLRGLGYEFLGEDGRRPGRWMFRRRGNGWFNLSIVPIRSDLWRDNLAIREYLLAHPQEALRYATVKREGARNCRGSLIGYQNHKRAYMKKLRERARRWASTSDWP